MIYGILSHKYDILSGILQTYLRMTKTINNTFQYKVSILHDSIVDSLLKIMVNLNFIMPQQTRAVSSYTSRKQSLEGWVGILVSRCPSVCLSICAPSVDMILSTHVLRHWCMDFSENLYIYNSLYENLHLEFSY